jgi:hypothetical protein
MHFVEEMWMRVLEINYDYSMRGGQQRFIEHDYNTRAMIDPEWFGADAWRIRPPMLLSSMSSDMLLTPIIGGVPPSRASAGLGLTLPCLGQAQGA